MTQQDEARVRELVIAIVREIGRVNGTSQVPQINVLPSSDEQKLYSLPAVVMTQTEDGFESYVAIRLNLLWDESKRVTDEAKEARDAANTAAGSANDAIGLANEKAQYANDQGDYAKGQGDYAKGSGDYANEKGTYANGQGDYANEKGTYAKNQGDYAKTQGDYAKDQGDYGKAQGDYAKGQGDRVDAAITACETATDEANNVDAEMNGMTVTITNRNGVTKSVNMSFDIYDSYPSIAAMLADLTHIPNGGLASIATDDPTDADNAKLYQKRSDGTLAYIGDLDQAAAQAWSEWFNTKKPLIEAATSYANEQGDYAKTQGANANSIWNTVKSWFNGDNDNGFKETSESWISSTQTAWDNWFSDSLATGVRKLWNDFWANINSKWTNFFGEEDGTPTKGVQKTWTDWFTGRATDWNNYKDAKDTDWTNYKSGKDTDWTSYKSGKDDNWTSYKSNKDADWTSYKDGKSTDFSTWVAARLSEWNIWWDARKSEWAAWFTNGVVVTWNDWFSDTAAVGVRKLWNGFWKTVNDDWYGTSSTDGLKKEAEDARDHAETQGDYAKNVGDHPTYIADGTASKPGDVGYAYQWDYDAQQYVKTIRVALDWNSMSQQEKDALAAEVLAKISFDDMPTQNSNKAVRSSGIYTAVTTLQDNIDTEETRAKAAEKANADDIDAIEAKIPAAATSQNQLADKAFVNISIATATADFKGTFTTRAGMDAVTGNKNDYAYLVTTDAAGNTLYNRYKWVEAADETAAHWAFEYALNNSSFTAAEWAAIQSGITNTRVAKLDALPTNAELITLLAGKDDVTNVASAETINDLLAEII